jgi:hypothetical protein
MAEGTQAANQPDPGDQSAQDQVDDDSTPGEEVTTVAANQGGETKFYRFKGTTPAELADYTGRCLGDQDVEVTTEYQEKSTEGGRRRRRRRRRSKKRGGKRRKSRKSQSGGKRSSIKRRKSRKSKRGGKRSSIKRRKSRKSRRSRRRRRR